MIYLSLNSKYHTTSQTMASSIKIVANIFELVANQTANETICDKTMEENDYYEWVPESKIKIGKGKVSRNNHFNVVQHFPKGKTNDIQKKTRALHIAMCAGTGIEPDFHFIRKNTAAKLRGSKAYYEKSLAMRAIQDVRRSRLLDMEDDITGVSSFSTECKPSKFRRRAVTDSPCAPLIPGSSFPHKKDMPRKTFRDALTSW